MRRALSMAIVCVAAAGPGAPGPGAAAAGAVAAGAGDAPQHEAPSPPSQPRTGPGGAAYGHAKVIHTYHGRGQTAYHLFEPAEPKPQAAPVIVFNHGYAAVDPVAYGAWIEHLVRRGNIVIYPRYQAGLYTSRRKLTLNAITGVKEALKLLDDGKHVKPDGQRFAIVGHSAGGIITANMAALWKQEGLPPPRAVMCVMPGLSRLFPLEDLAQIPADALLLTLAGDSDRITGRRDAQLIIARTTQIPAKNKGYVLLQSDTRGVPNLRASHLAPIAVAAKDIENVRAIRYRLRRLFSAGDDDAAPLAEDESPFMTDALDYYGTWKLLDGLCDAAFHGKHREYALGDTPKQRFMGEWSDGKPVSELRVEAVDQE